MTPSRVVLSVQLICSLPQWVWRSKRWPFVIFYPRPDCRRIKFWNKPSNCEYYPCLPKKDQAACTSPIVLVHQGTHRCNLNRCEAQRIKNAANRYRPVSASQVIYRSARHDAEHFAKQLHNKLSLDAKPTLRQTQGLPESPDTVALRERQAVGEALPLDSAQLSLHAAAEVQKGRHCREAERLVDGCA
ncbi:hypothetical protein ACEK07_46815 [Alcanivoracaceae bacterium MT1]